jgi:hypothetical protein
MRMFVCVYAHIQKIWTEIIIKMDTELSQLNSETLDKFWYRSELYYNESHGVGLEPKLTQDALPT